MEKKALLFLLIPFIVISGLFAYQYFTYLTGEEILLQTMPIDPVDLFRGNYVRLGYNISTMDASGIPNSDEIATGEIVYASLSQKDTYWTIDGISTQKPTLSENQVCMKGTVTSNYKSRISVAWGIESFFAPTDTAKQIEARQRGRESVVSIVAVDSFCNSVLKALVVNEEVIKTR